MQTPPETPRSCPACRHLRAKEMYYQGDPDDACSSGVYWCALTQEPLGPDGEVVGKDDCCDRRTCYLS